MTHTICLSRSGWSSQVAGRTGVHHCSHAPNRPVRPLNELGLNLGERVYAHECRTLFGAHGTTSTNRDRGKDEDTLVFTLDRATFEQSPRPPLRQSNTPMTISPALGKRRSLLVPSDGAYAPRAGITPPFCKGRRKLRIQPFDTAHDSP